MKKISALIVACCALQPLLSQAATSQITPAISFAEEANDNILFVAKDRKDDLITTVSPQLTMAEKAERLSAQLSSTFDSLSYQNNPHLNTIDYTHKANATYKLTPVLTMSGNADISRDSQPDRELKTSGIALSNSNRDLVSGSLGAQYALSEKASGLAYLTYGKSDYQDPTLVGMTSYGQYAEIDYELGSYLPRTSGRLNLGHSRYGYTVTTVDTYSLSMGIRRNLSETYKIGLSVGPRYSESRFYGQTSNNSGIGGDLSLTYTGETTNYAATISRDEQGVSGSAGVAERTSFSFWLEKKFFDDIRCGLDLEYRDNTSNPSVYTLAVNEIYASVATTIKYLFSKDLSLEGEYRYAKFTNRALTTGDEGRDRNQLFIRLNLKHPLFD